MTRYRRIPAKGYRKFRCRKDLNNWVAQQGACTIIDWRTIGMIIYAWVIVDFGAVKYD